MSKKKVIKAGSKRTVIETFEPQTVEEAANVNAAPSSMMGATMPSAGFSLDSLGSVNSGEINFGGAAESSPSAAQVVPTLDPEILAAAEREADQLRNDANVIIGDARIEAEKILDEARQRGYEEGMEQAGDIAKEELTPIMTLLIEAQEKAADVKNVILKQNEEEIINLSLDIARKVLDAELTANPAFVGNVIKKAMERIDLSEEVTVNVNPADYEILMHNLPEELKRVWLVADSKIPRGGALVDAESSTFDARVETQLKLIGESLKKEMLD